MSQFCRRCGYTIAWNAATVPSPRLAPQQSPVSKPAAVPPPRAARRPAPPTPTKPRAGGVFGILAIFGAILFFSNLSLRSKSHAPATPTYTYPSFKTTPTYSPPVYSPPTYSPPTYYVPRGNSMTAVPQPAPIVIPEIPRSSWDPFRPGRENGYRYDKSQHNR